MINFLFFSLNYLAIVIAVVGRIAVAGIAGVGVAGVGVAGVAVVAVVAVVAGVTTTTTITSTTIVTIVFGLAIRLTSVSTGITVVPNFLFFLSHVDNVLSLLSINAFSFPDVRCITFSSARVRPSTSFVGQQ